MLWYNLFAPTLLCIPPNDFCKIHRKAIIDLKTFCCTHSRNISACPYSPFRHLRVENRWLQRKPPTPPTKSVPLYIPSVIIPALSNSFPPRNIAERNIGKASRHRTSGLCLQRNKKNEKEKKKKKEALDRQHALRSVDWKCRPGRERRNRSNGRKEKKRCPATCLLPSLMVSRAYLFFICISSKDGTLNKPNRADRETERPSENPCQPTTSTQRLLPAICTRTVNYLIQERTQREVIHLCQQ